MKLESILIYVALGINLACVTNKIYMNSFKAYVKLLREKYIGNKFPIYWHFTNICACVCACVYLQIYTEFYKLVKE